MPDQLDPEMPAELIGKQRSNVGSRVLIGAGILLVLLGMLHVPVWMMDGSDWEGRVSWRKPILFGVSTGMTLWSLGWIVGALKQSRFDAVDCAVSFTTTASLVVEVALITLQQWRGRASHFNQDTPLDGRIDSAMFFLICIAFLGIVYFGFRTFSSLRLDAGYCLAARSGMVFLILSCVIGFVISGHGYARTKVGLPPETYGQNGVVKFPHGVAIHVLQILPAILLLLQKLGFRPNIRKQFVWYISSSFLSLLIFACVQTVAGHARFEINFWLSYFLLLVAGTLVFVPIASVTLSIALNRSFAHVLEHPPTIEK